MAAFSTKTHEGTDRTAPLSRMRRRVLCSTALLATFGSGVGLTGWLSSDGGINAPAAAAATIPVMAGPPITELCSYYNTWLAPRSGGRQHQGVDIIAKAGVPLKAVVTGTIIKVNPDYPGSMAGNHINLQVAGGKTYYVYLHLQSFAPGMAVGTKVTVGDVIGFVGTTGASSTPHLHFEVHPDGTSVAIDPTPIVTAAGTCGAQGHDTPVPGTTPGSTPPASTTAPKPTTTTAPAAAASAGATRGKPAPPISGPKPATPAPSPIAPTATTTPTPGTVATIPVAPVTTAAPAPTAPPAPVPTTPTASLGVDVLLTGRVNAYETVSAQVVGAPGLPASASAVEVTITVASSSSGRAVVWPCGSPGNIETGTPLAVNAGETSTRVVVTPGVGGQICLMSELDVAFRVTIDSFH
jgi:Peptidase family M23